MSSTYRGLKPVEETDTFGSVMRDCRHRVGLTLRAVADRVGVNYTYLSKLENDRDAPPSEATITRLAEVYGVSVEYLLQFTRRPTESLKARLRTGPIDLCRFVVLLGQRDLSERELLTLLNVFHQQDKREIFE